MRLGDKAKFKDKQKLYLLVNFRIAGYSINSLATLFSCDKGAVRYECRKYGVLSEHEPVSFTRDISEALKSDPHAVRQWAVIDGERVNMGHNYDYYVKNLSPVKR